MECPSTVPDPYHVWGVPFHPLTYEQTVQKVDALIRDRRPSYIVTANLNYVMITDRDPSLRPVNDGAAFVLADGKPLVWASRWKGTPLPERVAGADLIYGLCDLAARRGHRVFLLGGGEGVAEEAARRLVGLFPGLRVVGTACPPFQEPTPEEEKTLLDRIRVARPDLLFVAFGQPKGERWIVRHHERLGVPVSIQIGAALDFAAGRVRRAPRWMQRCGLEFLCRIIQEPGRLAPRYARNALFMARMILRDARGALGRLAAGSERTSAASRGGLASEE